MSHQTYPNPGRLAEMINSHAARVSRMKRATSMSSNARTICELRTSAPGFSRREYEAARSCDSSSRLDIATLLEPLFVEIIARKLVDNVRYRLIDSKSATTAFLYGLRSLKAYDGTRFIDWACDRHPSRAFREGLRRDFRTSIETRVCELIGGTTRSSSIIFDMTRNRIQLDFVEPATIINPT